MGQKLAGQFEEVRKFDVRGVVNTRCCMVYWSKLQSWQEYGWRRTVVRVMRQLSCVIMLWRKFFFDVMEKMKCFWWMPEDLKLEIETC